MSKPSIRSRLGPLLHSRRIGMFLLVGGMGAVIDNGVLYLLVEFAGSAPVWGAVVSKELSILTMFVVNENWTFSEHADGPVLQRLVKSNVLRLGGLAVGVATLYALHTWAGVWYLAANVVGIGVGFVVNYVFESTFTWQVHADATPEQ